MAVTVVHALLWSYRKTSCDFRVIINWKLTIPPQKEKFLFNPECHYAYSSRIKKKNKAKIDCLLDFGFVLEQYEVMQESFLSVEF